MPTEHADPPPGYAGTAYAQTNIQLYNQLLELGWAGEAVEGVRRAYELAGELFRALEQPSGKPLLAHLVGTASILAAQRLPVAVVAGGLVHAAYPRGVFRRWRDATLARRRRRVREAVGAEAEELAARYARLPWNPRTIEELPGRLGGLDAVDRRVLLIRIANELEDHLDLGMHYAPESPFHALYRGPALEILVKAAEALGRPGLGAELQRIVGASNRAERPAVLRRRTP